MRYASIFSIATTQTVEADSSRDSRPLPKATVAAAPLTRKAMLALDVN